ncbi:MAG: Fe-S cluster assembly sulfur transfer protein SufU [bacterium]
MYRDVVLDHYRSPRGRAPVADPDVENQGVNPLCGDEVQVAVKLDGAVLKALHVHGRGCSISTASGSMMAELLKGKSKREAELLVEAFTRMMRGEGWPDGLEQGDLDALEGVRKFPVRVKCALLPWTTLADALAALETGRRAPPAPTTTDAGEGP